MLRLVSYDIVFQEIPGEVTLALNISGCPNRCQGCHSPHLWEDIGEQLDEAMLAALLGTYGDTVTCVCFMGGDAEPEEVERLALFVKGWGGRRETGSSGSEAVFTRGGEPIGFGSGACGSGGYGLKTGWYSGREDFPRSCSAGSFDYVKLGPYIPSRGGLRSVNTNQRMYKIVRGIMEDITCMFNR